MAGPIDPRLLRRARATRIYLAAGVAVGSLTAVATLGQAWLISQSVADIVGTGGLRTLAWAVGGLAAVFGAKAVLTWAGEWLGHRAAAAVKSQLRRDLMTARLARPVDAPGSTAGLITLVTQGLDALDGYFSKYLPQLALAVTVPLVVGVAILGADLTSALIVALTLPLIPVFMALVGWTTEKLTRRRWATQTRLAGHFADLIAGLPTLQVFGRAKAQAEGLRRSETAHRGETMRTLRVSFLSALVLELLATLSVAVIAVTVGFRVLYGDLDLATALFVLILAPEAYLPVRQVGVHYHDAADGIAAADAAFDLIDAGAALATTSHGGADPHATDGRRGGSSGAAVLTVRGLSHTYPGTQSPALLPTSFEVHRGEVVALAGASGCGKTTLLNAAMGFLTPTAGSVSVAGPVAWVGQQPGLIPGTVADNVRLGFPDATDLAVRDALDLAGGASIALDHLVGDEAEGVSAGERRRIAVARALLRVTLGRARLLVLDEPTAGLDAGTEAELLTTLRRLRVAALVVSHRPAVLAEADRVITLLAPRPATPHEASTPIADGEVTANPSPTAVPSSASARATPATHAVIPAATTAFPAEAVVSPEPSKASLLRRVFAAVPGSRKRLTLAGGLAFLATGSSVALMAVSAWLLSRAAELPPVLSLYAPATAVRAFGIGRGAFRYAERLAGHDVALRLQSALRLETYTTLARTTLLGRRRGDLLTRVIADVEAIQDLVVRVWLPFASASLVLLATAGVLGILSPGAALVLLATSALAGLVVPALARRASTRADAAMLPLRGQLAESAHAIARTAPDLIAYGADGTWLTRFETIDRKLRSAAERSAVVRGIAGGTQVLAAGAAVIGALVIGGQQVASGTLAPVMLAVLVLTPLALHEALANLIASAQTHTRARAALDRVSEVLDAPPVGAGDRTDTGGHVDRPSLTLTGLTAGWPGNQPVVADLDLRVAPGEKVALVGPSGIGKTTVAATVLGLIPPVSGEVAVAGRVGYLAQDAHIFTTTIDENVRIGNRDATPEQVADALARAGLDLDPSRIVGEAGTTLSGGEARRVALARILVGDYQVLVLDEPTEHLDSATATALVDDLWATSAGRPVLVITHDPALVTRCDRVVDLTTA
ncbi:MAG: thiol reductant ABC exporter subunit CydD [Actinobacteria bacterium]|nr:thiol reductant ABC exporter subunit CydD [Actinomycetota bacterium]